MFFGIGIYHTKTEINVGSLYRSAFLMGASFVFTIGKRYKRQASDTCNVTKQIPYFDYKTFDEFYANMPIDCKLICVELIKSAKSIYEFEHPKNAIYLLGAEDQGIPAKIIERCHETIFLPTEHSLNVANMGTIVCYDRKAKEAYRGKK
jgi:tRNA(Leu) C34 or U34 (ribose-2'-O)-methylase TrmL